MKFILSDINNYYEQDIEYLFAQELNDYLTNIQYSFIDKDQINYEIDSIYKKYLQQEPRLKDLKISINYERSTITVSLISMIDNQFMNNLKNYIDSLKLLKFLKES